VSANSRRGLGKPVAHSTGELRWLVEHLIPQRPVASDAFDAAAGDDAHLPITSLRNRNVPLLLTRGERSLRVADLINYLL